ncbi:hypothetical protein Trco_004550 [Trichoderma cornu-damae]|uniref:Uncharacterized protein n=1 Tax=Trichoderma cornu-damae TaxID=654480 RepID=A0A9P8QTB1_9HYPO|nr:hypothetical protein Trco_004550 [Trichoderma cornu-damae]
MVKRGRPSLNLTPEERLQRRRRQLVASQRKRRAHKRLSQPSKPSPTASPEKQVPAALWDFSDAVFLAGRHVEDAVSQQYGVGAMSKASCAASQDSRSTMVAVCQYCGLAPLDMAGAVNTAMSPSSAASLLWSPRPGTDTYALSSRLAGLVPSSAWADYTSATWPDKAGPDQDPFAQERLVQACTNMPPQLGLAIDPFDLVDAGLDGGFLLSELDASSPLQSRDAAAFATRMDSVFLPEPSNRSDTISFWMPPSPPETSSARRGRELSK